MIDLETTGGSPTDDRITEVGAVLLRGGECLGTFQTLVNPRCRVPTAITVLTGITEPMLVPAPPIEAVLPSLLQFWGDAVFVGHNVALRPWLPAGRLPAQRPGHARRPPGRHRGPRPPAAASTRSATTASARWPSSSGSTTGPATGRWTTLWRPATCSTSCSSGPGASGCSGLDDLLGLPKIDRHPQADKLKLTNQLPRRPGVYIFRDRAGRPLYVGKATNLRTRVRSYFSSDRRRKVAQLLRETVRIDHTVCAGPMEAEVLEVRLIAEWTPRFNRVGTRAGGVRLPEAHLERAVPPPLGRTDHQGRRRVLPRPAAQQPVRQTGRRGHRDQRAAAALHQPTDRARSRRRVPPPSSACRPAPAPGT